MAENRRFGLEIDAQTGASNWGGEAMDYDVPPHTMSVLDGLCKTAEVERKSVHFEQ